MSEKTITISEIQAKTEVIKAAFVELATAFEVETGTHLHLSVSHKHGDIGSKILTCDVQIPEVTA